MITGEGARRGAPGRVADRRAIRRAPVSAPAEADHQAEVVDDVSLVNASIDGSLVAFEELYTRYFPRVRAFCYRKTGNPELAQDITQEAFTRAFERIDGFGGPKKFASWVGTIAANLVTDHYRRKSTSDVPLDPAEDADRMVAEEVDPLAALARQDARAVILPALATLKPRQREALLLHEIEGLSCAAVGQRFGISEGAAESLVARGRRRLRREILAKASPKELLGMGAIGPMVPVWRAWDRVKESATRKAAWLHDSAAHGLNSLGVNAAQVGQGAKALTVVLGTALALDAAAALIPQEASPAAVPRPATITESAEEGTSDPTAVPGPREGILERAGPRSDFDVDPESRSARGSVQGNVGSPRGGGEGPVDVGYDVVIEGDTERGFRTGGHVFANDRNGNTLADSGRFSFGP